jgi:DNA invertase Pin-like site-specific DNA recombinase
MFQVPGTFSEFERVMIRERVKSGMERAKAEQDAGKVRRDASGKKLRAMVGI